MSLSDWMKQGQSQLRRLEGCLGKLPEDQRALVEGYYYRREDIAELAGGSGRTATATYKASIQPLPSARISAKPRTAAMI